MAAISNTIEGQLISCQDLPPKTAIFGQSKGMQGLRQIVEKVARASVPILILGENGTGKEVIARYIHTCSPGISAPFLKLSPPLPDGRAIDEVAFCLEPEGGEDDRDFGGNRDSTPRPGTLFVEEVAQATQERQLELLQLIGGARSFVSSEGADIRVAPRIIGSSTYDLESRVVAGKFRGELLSVLRVVTLRLPSLRERKEDIPQLANYFWQIYSQKFGCKPQAPSSQLIHRLQQYDWPGNIRELENVMKRYVVLGIEGIKGISDTDPLQQPSISVPSPQNSVSLKDVTRQAAHALERKIILRTLQEMQWNRRRTARALKISYRALLYKIKEAGLLAEEPKTAVGVDRHGQVSEHTVA